MGTSTADRDAVRAALEHFRQGERDWEALVEFVGAFPDWRGCEADGPWVLVVGAWVDGWLTEAQLQELYRSARGEVGTTIDLTAAESVERTNETAPG